MSSKKLVKGYKKEETSSRAIEVVDLSYLHTFNFHQHFKEKSLRMKYLSIFVIQEMFFIILTFLSSNVWSENISNANSILQFLLTEDLVC